VSSNGWHMRRHLSTEWLEV